MHFYSDEDGKQILLTRKTKISDAIYFLDKTVTAEHWNKLGLKKWLSYEKNSPLPTKEYLRYLLTPFLRVRQPTYLPRLTFL